MYFVLQGDSGGPLVCNHEGEDILAGLTSFGISGCSTDYPSVYTRVAEYVEWVTDIMDAG